MNYLKYRYIEHTSDLGVEIFGKDLVELFKNGCFAIFDNIIEDYQTKVNLLEEKGIELESENLQELFFDWLRELLFIFGVEFFIPQRIKELKIKKNKGLHLSAKLAGERFDVNRHEVKIEIKTPTYHMYQIEESKAGYKATVIFDV